MSNFQQKPIEKTRNKDSPKKPKGKRKEWKKKTNNKGKTNNLTKNNGLFPAKSAGNKKKNQHREHRDRSHKDTLV